ncbi:MULTISPECIES: hypothetical protein [Methylosinus]|jgi:hypothetical protein|uniref:hypothetical protein n=1 Tax=Methylosinus TaxID=425 RepID=UPI0001D2E06E|nr:MULTISPECIES: hypothetical protein [Methylosinus]
MTNDPSDTPNAEPSLAERMERALLLIAWLIEIDGDIHIALFERMEAELRDAQRKAGVKERARRLLADYSGRSGASKAICDRNLSFSSSDGPRPYLGL